MDQLLAETRVSFCLKRGGEGGLEGNTSPSHVYLLAGLHGGCRSASGGPAGKEMV